MLDDTLVIYIAGDNGASAEGGLDGTFNELKALNGIPETVDEILPRLDEIGSADAFNHYPVGWAHAMNAPVPVDQAGRVPLRRHPQRDGDVVAERHLGAR